jgi:MscS family membrane protein
MHDPLAQDILHFFMLHRWMLTIAMILICMSIFHWFSRVVYRFLLHKFDHDKHIWISSLIKSVHVPWLTFFWLMAISFIIPIIMRRFDIDLSHISAVNTIRSLFFIGAFYWSMLKFIGLIEQEIAPRSSRRMFLRDKTTLRAVALLSRIALTILTILAVLPMMGFKTGSLLAFGGVGGLGIAFAAKETLANFLGGMMIFWDRPFSVGDWIRSPDRNIEGTVEHIGWRLTRIRTFSKRPLYVPNGIFSTIAIENPQRMSNRQINTTVGVRYSDATLIGSIVKETEEMIRQHPGIDPMQTIMVHFVEFGPSSLNLNIYAFTKTTDWNKYRQVQQDVFLKTIAIIAAHGAECAFPTTTVHISHDNNQPSPQS